MTCVLANLLKTLFDFFLFCDVFLYMDNHGTSVLLFIYFIIYLFIYLSIYLFIYLFTYLSIYHYISLHTVDSKDLDNVYIYIYIYIYA